MLLNSGDIADCQMSDSMTDGVEIKITYQVNQQHEDQEYGVEIFIFFPKELESHEIGFYHNLWTTVRLHPPEVLQPVLCHN